MSQKVDIKEYKEFTTITNIRKLTQQAITPIVKSIETQMNQLVNDNMDMRKNMNRIDQVFKQGADIRKQIQKNHKNLEDYKDLQNYKKVQDEKKMAKISSQQQKFVMEIQQLRSLIKAQSQQIDSMKTKNEKMSALYSSLDSRNDLTIKDMQEKYNRFITEILQTQKTINDFYNNTQIEVDIVKETFKKQRDVMEEKQKAIDLFFQERDSMNSKIQDTYTKLIDRVTKQEFQGFRKTQVKNFEESMSSINEQLLQILPVSLRKILPEIQKRLKEVDHIKQLGIKLDEESSKIQHLKLVVSQNSQQTELNQLAITERLEAMQFNMDNNIQQEIKKVQEIIQRTQNQISNKVMHIKDDMREELQQKLQRQSAELHKTIEHQIRATMSDNRDEELQQEIDEIREIKQRLYDRSVVIEEIGNSIDQKIISYSSKISKIKSDYQLFADGIRKQISGVIRMKQKFNEHFQQVGRVLSTFGQFLLIGGSFHYQSLAHIYRYGNDRQIFVTQEDGIIYEFSDQIKKIDRNKISYRKKRLQTKHFIKSYMYTMVSYIDEIFQNYQCLNWRNNKPSTIFVDQLLETYMNRVSKSSVNRCSERQNKNIAHLQGDVDFQPNDFQGSIFENMTNSLSKKFNRTISRLGGGNAYKTERLLNSEQRSSELRKNYSIKRTKVSQDKNRYEQCYSSRSNCKSRMNKLT